jgi:hypothetical protein
MSCSHSMYEYGSSCFPSKGTLRPVGNTISSFDLVHGVSTHSLPPKPLPMLPEISPTMAESSSLQTGQHQPLILARLPMDSPNTTSLSDWSFLLLGLFPTVVVREMLDLLDARVNHS